MSDYELCENGEWERAFTQADLGWPGEERSTPDLEKERLREERVTMGVMREGGRREG